MTAGRWGSWALGFVSLGAVALTGCGGGDEEATDTTTPADRSNRSNGTSGAESAPARAPVDELAELVQALDSGDAAVAVTRLRGSGPYGDRDVEQARLECLSALEALVGGQENEELSARCSGRLQMLVQLYTQEETGPAPPPPADFAPSANPIDVSGTLSDSDPLVPSDNSPYHDYPIDLRAGWRLVIDMTSTDFDTYLWVIDSAGRSLVQDDDGAGAGGTNSHIELPIPYDGRFLIRANSFDASGRGAYELHARVLGASE
ncbi:MAG: pre-peptidase C-terminal domain-containing protein [Sandaracinaceae bacterium]